MSIINRITNRLKDIKDKIPGVKSNLKAFLYYLDIRFCCRFYHIMYEEYFRYCFYRLSHYGRKEFVLENDVVNRLPDLVNDINDRDILDNKLKFNSFFKDYIGRDYISLENNNYSIFKDFLKNHSIFLKKPLNDWCGHGVQKYELKANNNDIYCKTMFDRLLENGPCIIEEILKQCKELSALNEDSVNTIRVLTLANKNNEINIPLAALRIGRKGSVIDNYCSGGMVAFVDVNSGIVVSPAIDRLGNKYYVHPDSNTQIIGFKIPYWNDIVKVVHQSASMLPKVRFIGWDVMIRNDGKPCLIEGNSNSDVALFQAPTQIGMKEIYSKYLECKF